MEERIFTLKKGTEFPEKFAGLTVPFQVPTTDAEIATLVPDQATRAQIFNEAYALRVQKHVKSAANAKDATNESIRAAGSSYKADAPKARSGPKEIKTEAQASRAAEQALLREMRQNPEMQARLAAKKAELLAKSKQTAEANQTATERLAPEAQARSDARAQAGTPASAPRKTR